MSVPSLTSLLQQADITDHEQVLAAATKKSKPHIRAVALLNLDRYAEAAQVLEDASLGETAGLELAYALYKSGREKEAAELAAKGKGRGYRHVEAQARYRNEEFTEAAELYRELGEDREEDAEADLRINSGAVDAQLEWSGGVGRRRKVGRGDLEAFEVAYNAACGCVARGELGQAEVLLKRAAGLCENAEELGEEERKAELAPILVQQVYVLIRLGRMEEAAKVAESVEMDKIGHEDTRLIAQTNSLAAEATPVNPYLAQRLVSKDISSLQPPHPFAFQTAFLNSNRYATALQSLKFSGTAESTSSRDSPPTTDAAQNRLSVVNAAAHAHNQTGKEALKRIVPVLDRRPNDAGLVLTVVQLHVLTGNVGAAITTLEAFLGRLEQNTASLDVRFAPGLVGLMVSLYQSQNRRAPAHRELAAAASHWRRKSNADRASGITSLLRAAGSALLNSQDPAQRSLAAEIFSDLHASDSSDCHATAGLLASASPDCARPKDATELTPISKLLGNIDVDALESAGLAVPPAAATTTRKRPAETQKQPSKAKKIRPSRMPKDFDANKTPDPERWLPLRDRSTYRPKGGKKGKARMNAMSQGAAPTGGAEESSRPTTPGGEVLKAQGQQGGNNKKKAKKGKR